MVFWQRSFGGGLVFWWQPDLLAAAWSSGDGLVFWRQAAATTSPMARCVRNAFVAENDRSRKLSCSPSFRLEFDPAFQVAFGACRMPSALSNVHCTGSNVPVKSQTTPAPQGVDPICVTDRCHTLTRDQIPRRILHYPLLRS